LARLCKSLNEVGAHYVVIAGFAIILAGFPRTTGDIDLLVETTPENEALVYRALEVLPDRAVRDLRPGELTKYSVIRVADEIVVDLMKSACGIEYPYTEPAELESSPRRRGGQTKQGSSVQ
jgi:hypothetical protein